MAKKPIILAVDDEPQVLGAINRDLRANYRKEYRIMKADSGAAGLEAAQTLKQRGDVVALFLSDQRSFYDLELLWGDSPRVPWSPGDSADGDAPSVSADAG